MATRSEREAGDFLAALRQTREIAEALPATCRPQDHQSAYAIQDVLVERLMAPHNGKCIGYKVACTNTYAQRLLGVDGPFYGQLLSSATHDAPARLAVTGLLHNLIEPEFAFEIAEDVPTRDTPYTAASILPYVGTLMPAIELVDWHYRDWAAVGALSLIADNAIHGAWIAGAPIADWQHLELATHPVQLIVNGHVMSEGTGANVLGHPLTVLAWLANELPRQGRNLKAGDRITTGVCTEVYDAQAGDTVRADFGSIGAVEICFD